MSTTTTSLSLDARPGLLSKTAAYVELTKPKIGLMVLVAVAAAGFVARWGQPDFWPLAGAVLGAALFAASANALNQWLEQDRDAVMPRTAGRPLPSGRLSAGEVVSFAAVTLVAGLVIMLVATNGIATLFAVATWLLYVWVYTPLKTKSVWNTCIGAIPGALPVLIGWTAVGGELDARAIALFGVVFLWQFPHFMAIAWLYRDQYARAEMKMLPVVDETGRRAGFQAVAAATALLLVSMTLALLAPASTVYAGVAMLLGVGQLGFALAFMYQPTTETARGLLRASLVYLPGLLLLLALTPLV